MTDEESKKAFEEWASGVYLMSERRGDEYFYSDTTAAFRGWKAATEWAVKAERNRCARMLAEMWVLEDMNVQKALRGLLDAIQEPK